MGIRRSFPFLRLVALVAVSAGWIALVAYSSQWAFDQLKTWFNLPKLDSEVVKYLFNGFGTVLLGVAPALMLWYFRDRTKHIDQNHIERDLQVKERDIKLKEDNDAWANFIKYQELAEDENISEGRRAAAIYALGEYYKRAGTQFPQQVHVFFKKYLDQYWESIPQYDHYLEARTNYISEYEESSENDKVLIETLRRKYMVAYYELFEPIEKIPEYIKAVHAVISSKSHEEFRVDGKEINLFHRENLDLSEFNLTGAKLGKANLTGAKLEYANLTRARLNNANLAGATLNNANLTGAELNATNLTSAYLHNANLTGAKLNNVNLTGAKLEKATLTGAELNFATLTGARLSSSNLTGALLGVFIERNYAKILFFKLFNVKKLGFRYDRGPWVSRWKYTIRYFFRNLHFLFIKWNFKPDCKDAKYDKSTKFPKWLDPAKAGMKKVCQKSEAPADE